MDKHGNRRQHMAIVPEPGIYVTYFMSRPNQGTSRAPLVFARQVHRITHAVPDDIKYLCKDAGILNHRLSQAIDLVDDSFQICVQNGRPLPSRKISMTHAHLALNQEVQVNFTYEQVWGTIRSRIVIADSGTGFRGTTVGTGRNIDTIIRCLEHLWFTRHDAPKLLSADNENNRRQFRGFLSVHSIKYKPTPARRHNKFGIVDRKNGPGENILGKLDRENSDASDHTLLARAAFFRKGSRAPKY